MKLILKMGINLSAVTLFLIGSYLMISSYMRMITIFYNSFYAPSIFVFLMFLEAIIGAFIFWLGIPTLKLERLVN